MKPNKFDLISLFGLAFPFIWAGSIVSLVICFLFDKRYFFILLIPFLFAIPYLRAYVNVSLPKGVDNENSFRVLSYNAMMGVKMVNKKHVVTKEIEGLFEKNLAGSPVPDILCFQEVNFIVEGLLKKTFDHPYYHKINGRGSIILSRYPIIKSGQVDFGPKLNSCLWADLQINERIVRIYSIHLESNRLKQKSYEFLNEDEYNSSEAISGIRDLVSKYPKYANQRADQVSKIREHIDNSPYPVIVCGDFNDPPMSYAYRVIKKGLNDAFISAGTGFGTTWLGSIPLLRIDYIFYSEQLKIQRYQRIDSQISDHSPISATFHF